MRVKVSPLYVQGRALFPQDRKRRAAYAGELKLMEERHHALGRMALTARVTSAIEPQSAPLELIDATLIWVNEGRMRLRGIELAEGAWYAQTWEVEPT